MYVCRQDSGCQECRVSNTLATPVYTCVGKTAVVKSAAAVLGVDAMEANCAKFVLGSDKQREQVCVFVFVCVRVCLCVRV